MQFAEINTIQKGFEHLFFCRVIFINFCFQQMAITHNISDAKHIKGQLTASICYFGILKKTQNNWYNSVYIERKLPNIPFSNRGGEQM